MIYSNNRKSFLLGLLITTTLALFALAFFYSPALKNPNKIFFVTDYDGLQNYYGHIYHVKYDSTYLRTSGMNYPYGEMIYYTGVQLVPASILKFISNNICDISDYMIGIQNILMISSILIAAIFLFLIFFELGVAWLPGSLAAIAIAFLSPQLDRFGGHFSLTYVFAIPLIVYLILRFNRKDSFVLSSLICFTSFWAFTTHPYFFGMNEALLLFYWGYYFYKNHKTWKSGIPHWFIQFVLPYVVVQLFGIISDHVTDRTQNPWGFLFSRATPEGVFLPFGKPYGRFLEHLFKSTSYISWEGVAYVGLIGVFASLIIFKRGVISVKSKHFARILTPFDNNLLNTLFWGSFITLLYSFGIPFVFKLEWLQYYIGPLKQMRAIGRFAWIFFYLINIIGVYIIWNYLKDKKYKHLIWIPLIILGYDSYLNASRCSSYVNNEFPLLYDKTNSLPENEWVKLIKPDNYQAIIPIPYFHLGSENIGIGVKCNNLKTTLYASLKTGLPTTAIYLCRTSISESYNSIQLAFEPYRKPLLLKSCKNRKPFLLLACKCETYSEGEIKMLKQGNLLFEGDQFSLYELPFNKLEHITDSLYDKAFNEYSTSKLFKHGELMTNTDTLNFVYQNFDRIKNSYETYLGNGSYKGNIKCPEIIFNGRIPNCDRSKEYTISFWFGNVLKDLYLRSALIIAKADSTGKAYQEEYTGMATHVVLIDGNWALCETKIKLSKQSDMLKIIVKSDELRKGDLLLDELLIKPTSTQIFKIINKGVVKNNRLYLKDRPN
jgi:hypothetical protein